MEASCFVLEKCLDSFHILICHPFTLQYPSFFCILEKELDDLLFNKHCYHFSMKVLIFSFKHEFGNTSPTNCLFLVSQSPFQYCSLSFLLMRLYGCSLKYPYVMLYLSDGMIISHLPFGPTAYFNLSNVIMRHDIPDVGTMSEAYPHLIFHNFNSRLGERVGFSFVMTDP